MHLSSEVFEQITGQRPRSAAKRYQGKRQAERVGFPATVTIIPVYGRLPDKPTKVTVANISTQGIAVFTPSPLRQGDGFYLRLLRTGERPLWVECQVVRWQPVTEKRFLVAAGFVRPMDSYAPSRPVSASSGERAAKPHAMRQPMLS